MARSLFISSNLACEPREKWLIFYCLYSSAPIVRLSGPCLFFLSESLIALPKLMSYWFIFTGSAPAGLFEFSFRLGLRSFLSYLINLSRSLVGGLLFLLSMMICRFCCFIKKAPLGFLVFNWAWDYFSGRAPERVSFRAGSFSVSCELLSVFLVWNCSLEAIPWSGEMLVLFAWFVGETRGRFRGVFNSPKPRVGMTLLLAKTLGLIKAVCGTSEGSFVLLRYPASEIPLWERGPS